MKQEDGALRGFYQSGSCACADWDTAEFVGIQGGTISGGEEFAQAAVGRWLLTGYELINRLLKKPRASARQGGIRRKSAVYTE